ncbi:MAG: TonB family protein [Cyclobacteriaceae bacterium]|nr:TonB family protein [Cyclobacteriaceae bacterium]
MDSETKKPVKNATVIIHETTAGTVANAVGFFELTLAPAQTTIIISSIGYITSKIDVPSANQFKIFLDKEYIELPILDSKTIRAKDSLAIEQPIKLGGESDAWYPGGWSEFYLDFYQALKADSAISKMDTTFNLKFSVSPDGEVVNINCSYQGITPNLSKAFNGIQRFESALQNGLKVSQHYSIIISVLSDELFIVVEVPAEPKGGIVAFYRFIGASIRYPKEAKSRKIQGQVLVEFIVNKDGSISDAKVLQGIGGGCDEEALRVLMLSPNWLPGTQRGKPVRQKMVIPIIFKLG